MDALLRGGRGSVDFLSYARQRELRENVRALRLLSFEQKTSNQLIVEISEKRNQTTIDSNLFQISNAMSASR